MHKRNAPTSLACLCLVIILLFALLAVAGCGRKEEVETVDRDEDATPSTPENGPSSDRATTSPVTTQPTEPSEPVESIEEKVAKVATDYVRSTNPDLPELRVLGVKVVDSKWARVDLEPVDKSTDPASAFLKEENGTWTVFDFGTGIHQELHPEAPAELFQ